MLIRIEPLGGCVASGADSMPDALPVAIDLPAPLRDEVAGWAEQHLGWQVVPLDGPPAPVLALVSTVPTPPSACSAVVVVDGPVDATAVRDAVAAGAVDALGWPDDRERLPTLAATRSHTRRVALGNEAERERAVVLAGVGGGVGTSTVALALAGVAAWSGCTTVVCGDDDVLGLAGVPAWQGPGGADLVALGAAAADEVRALAQPVPGIPGLAALGRGRGIRDTVGWPADLVVVDAGPLPPSAGVLDVDAVVARPDARLARLERLDVPLVLVGDAPLSRDAVARRLGRPPAAQLAWSQRVAVAGVRGRVPAALPGTWLRELRGLVRALPAAREAMGAPAAEGHRATPSSPTDHRTAPRAAHRRARRRRRGR